MPGEEHHLQYVPETSSVSMAFIGWSALSALLLLGISIGGLYFIYRSTVPSTPLLSPQTFPQPRVDARENEQLHRIIDAQNERLKTWGWADAQHTLAQIPIERAMQLLATKGNDAYTPLLPAQAALSSPTSAAERATMGSQQTQGAARATKNSFPETPK